jgi:hypothetical protein
VLFYAFQSQFTPQVAGWGGNAGSDEFERPLILVMSWHKDTVRPSLSLYQLMAGDELERAARALPAARLGRHQGNTTPRDL